MTEQYTDPEDRPIRHDEEAPTVTDPILPDLEIPDDAATER
jgi:hypothetical protein